MKVRIGVGLGASVDGFGAVLDRLEDLGVDSVWLSEHVGGTAPDPVVGLAYAAARTTTLKLGTGVTILPGRNPVVLAKQLASLAELAPRRILPALGLGPAAAAERSAFPVPPGRRGDVFDEALLLLRRLLTEPAVTFTGEFFRLDGVGLGSRPERPLDLWLGGSAPAALRRIGRYGDGWLASLVTPSEAGAAIATIRAAAAAEGRAIEDDHYGLSLPVAFDGVPPQLGAALRAHRSDVPIEDLVPVGWAAAARLVQAHVAVGVTKFVIRPAAPPDWNAFLTQFAAELMPLESG